MILEQTYSEEHWKSHWDWLLDFFKHEKYITVEGKPMLILYRPHEVPRLSSLVQFWHSLAKQAGTPYLAQCLGTETLWLGVPPDVVTLTKVLTMISLVSPSS